MLVVAAGCSSSTSILNPGFLQALGLGPTAADQPGEAPTIVIEVENNTGRILEYRVTWRDADGTTQERIGGLAVAEKYSESVICPVTEMTLGDVGDLSALGAIVRLGNGDPEDPFIDVEPFGVLLQEEINYFCGDVVTFTVLPSSATQSGFQAYAFIRESGAQTP